MRLIFRTMARDIGPFARLLSDARAAAGLTRDALANRTNLNYSYVYRLETGSRKPSREVVFSLADALGVTGEMLNQWLLALGLAPVPGTDEVVRAVRTRGGIRFQKGPAETLGEAGATRWPVLIESMGLREAETRRLLRALSEATPAARAHAARLVSGTVSYLLNLLESPVKTAVIPAAKENAFVAPSTTQRILMRAINEVASLGVSEVVLVLAPGMVESIYAPLRMALDMALVPKVELRYCFQQEPEGLGDAVLRAEGLVGDAPFALVLPDDLVNEHSVRGERPSELRRMAEALVVESDANLVLVAPVPKSKMPQYGVVVVGEPERPEGGRPITRLVEKPDQDDSSRLPARAFGIVGRYILQPEIFQPLKELKARGARPLHLTAALDVLLAAGRKVRAIELKATRQDLGEVLKMAGAAINVD
jgi:UTP--glucose-1-phosphate uridylyltransferase